MKPEAMNQVLFADDIKTLSKKEKIHNLMIDGIWRTTVEIVEEIGGLKNRIAMQLRRLGAMRGYSRKKRKRKNVKTIFEYCLFNKLNKPLQTKHKARKLKINKKILKKKIRINTHD